MSTVPVTRSYGLDQSHQQGPLSFERIMGRQLGGRHAAGSQPLPRTQRAKSSVLTLLRHRIVPTRCPVKRPRFNKSVRTCIRPGTPAIEQSAAP